VNVDDVKVSQATHVSPHPAYEDRFITPDVGTLWGFDANKRPFAIKLGANLALVGDTLNATGGGGGSGTVTSFSSGNLSPLFSTNVSTPSTTPALAFSLTAQAQKTFLAGPLTGADTGPSFRVIAATDIPDLSSTYQPLNTNLSSIGGLSNASGWLHNNGLGIFSYSTPTYTDVGADPAGAAAAITLSGLGGVPTTRQVNGHALSSDITVTKGDVGLGSVTDDAQVKRTEMGAALGVATLDSSSKLLTSQLPSIAISEYLGSVASQAAMLSLTGEQGDWCIRTDLGTTWIITGTPPSVIGSWTQLSYPTAPVTSVAGRTGAVTLTSTDVGLNNLTNSLQLVAASNLSDLVSAATARGNLGGTTAGQSFFTLANPSAITFPRINADNTVTTLDSASFRTAIGAGTGGGTVTSLSVVTANGFAGTVANATTTPAITLTTSITGILKGNGTSISSASAGTDFVAPGSITTSGLTQTTNKLLGRATSLTGAIEEISLGFGMVFASGELRTPQDLRTTGSPTFSNLTADGNFRLSSYSSGPLYVNDTGDVLRETSLSVVRGGTGKSSIAASRLLWSTGSNTLGEISLGYGITVTSSELRTPQDLQSTASPTFGGATIDARGVGYALLTLNADVTNNSSGLYLRSNNVQEWALISHLGGADAFGIYNNALSANALSINRSNNQISLGTIAAGVWHGTAIADAYIASATTWNAKMPAFTLGNSLAFTGSVLDTIQDIRTSASPGFLGVTLNKTGAIGGSLIGLGTSEGFHLEASSGNNVFEVQQKGAGVCGIRFIDIDGLEAGAMGYGEKTGTVGLPFRDMMYVEMGAVGAGKSTNHPSDFAVVNTSTDSAWSYAMFRCFWNGSIELKRQYSSPGVPGSDVAFKIDGIGGACRAPFGINSDGALNVFSGEIRMASSGASDDENMSWKNGTRQWNAGIAGSIGSSSFFIKNVTAGTYDLIIDGTSGLAQFNKAIQTGSPSGGTAKPVKFGAAATVTPTSPNRTIELEVDGTTYYLAAKTTNN
jgi:hypothetical protein